ncbi:hypothetical protein MTYM_00103 [Methylococcales bacterium]|nr:hypothetical protein MTYM_00103 [Methylococcales bacterium]
MKNIRMAHALRVVLLWGVFSGMAWSDIPLQDNKEILGKWLLESVSAGIDKPKVEENRTWEFRADGVVVTSGYNRHLKMEDSREFKYAITDGKIKADDPGRPGKTVDYAVYEKTGDRLILKGGLEGFYFFKKK